MDNDQNTCSQGSGPGSLLCQARVAQGLSREEVAQRLHMAPRQIVALENDDYPNLPGPTYVRGYLRAYASLLELKPERILAAYAALSGSNKKHSLSSLAPKEEITSQDHQIKLATYVVVAIVLGLAVTWWQGREVEPGKPHPEQVAALPPAAQPDEGAATDSAGLMDLPSSADLTAGGVDVPVVTPADPVLAPTPERSVSVPIPPVTTPVRERAVTAKPVPTPVPTSLSTPMPSPASGTPAGTPAAATPPGIRANLVLYADEESWIDVRDASQNKLIYENVPAGRRVVLEGAVPLKLFIGNAPGVRVEFNGKPYDISPYKRGLIARFTLGQELVQHPDNTTGR